MTKEATPGVLINRLKKLLARRQPPSLPQNPAEVDGRNEIPQSSITVTTFSVDQQTERVNDSGVAPNFFVETQPDGTTKIYVQQLVEIVSKLDGERVEDGTWKKLDSGPTDRINDVTQERILERSKTYYGLKRTKDGTVIQGSIEKNYGISEDHRLYRVVISADGSALIAEPISEEDLANGVTIPNNQIIIGASIVDTIAGIPSGRVPMKIRDRDKLLTIFNDPKRLANTFLQGIREVIGLTQTFAGHQPTDIFVVRASDVTAEEAYTKSVVPLAQLREKIREADSDSDEKLSKLKEAEDLRTLRLSEKEVLERVRELRTRDAILTELAVRGLAEEETRPSLTFENDERVAVILSRHGTAYIVGPEGDVQRIDYQGNKSEVTRDEFLNLVNNRHLYDKTNSGYTFYRVQNPLEEGLTSIPVGDLFSKPRLLLV